MQVKQASQNLKKTFLISVVAAFGYCNNAMAQYDEKVTVIGDYEPSISDAYKINLNPKISDTAVEKPALTYSIQPRIIYAKYDVEPIQAAKVAPPTLSKLYKNYVRIGFGNYSTPYAEFYANSLRSKEYSLGVGFLHHSGAGKIKDYAYPGFSRNQFSLDGKKFYKKSLLSGDFNYTRNVNHSYGYKPDDFTAELTKDDIRQRCNLLETKIRYKSMHADSNHLNYALILGHYYLGDINKSSEHNIHVGAGIDKRLELFDFTDNQTMGLLTDIDFYSNHDSTDNHNANIISFQPFISTNFDEYAFYLGLKAISYADSNSNFRIFPLAEAKLSVIREVLSVYAGITGGVERSGFRVLSDINPYVVSVIPMNFTIDEFRFYAGMLSSLSKHLDFSANLSSSTIKHMPLYVNDTSSHFGNDFTVVYDDVNKVNLTAEMIFHKDKKWRCALKGNWYQYITTNESEAWQKPSYDVWLSLGYNIQDKININCDIYTVGKSLARTFDTLSLVVPADIDAYADFNLELEYRYTKILSGFLRFNNIGATRYYRWYNYPSYRFNFLAGITYSF